MSQDNLQFFISYSHTNMRLKEKLITSLKALEYDFHINSFWHDGEISAGKNIDKEILKQLNKSDIILLLISSEFLASYYCIEVELKKAIARMKKQECMVIPIILSECVIADNMPFSKLKRLPLDGHPICSRKFFQNQSVGCSAVVRDLRVYLKKEFPNAVIKKKRKTVSKNNTKDCAYIELYKDGKLQRIEVTETLILSFPRYHKSIHIFRTMMEQALVKAKQIYSKEFKKYKNLSKTIPNSKRLEYLRMFLMDICTYTKIYITESIGIKVHFRVSKDDKYLGLIASTDNDDSDDLAADWTTLMTSIPIYEGLIYHSHRLHAPLLKSLNNSLNYRGKNDKIWKDYVTFTFDNICNGQTPLVSYCISVHKDYYNIKGDSLKVLAFLNLGDVVEKFICDYCEICRNIDKDYDLKLIIDSI